MMSKVKQLFARLFNRKVARVGVRQAPTQLPIQRPTSPAEHPTAAAIWAAAGPGDPLSQYYDPSLHDHPDPRVRQAAGLAADEAQRRYAREAIMTEAERKRRYGARAQRG